MDHPLIGNERQSARQNFAATRRTAYVPPLNLAAGKQGSGERLERHLAAVAPSAGTAVATRPAPTRGDVAQATALLREITPRGDALSSVPASRRRLSLFAPLRKVRRWFGF
jgi:hypothetical protein